MRFNTILLAGSALAVAMAAPAAAVTITGLKNTGVDGSNVAVVGVGVTDQHWTLTNGTAYVSGQNGVFPLNGPWLADTATSRWITPQPRAGVDLDPVADGLYFYNLGFSLTGFQPGTASFSGRFAADNLVTEIRLNGNLLAASGGGFSSWTNFAANSGFVAGANTLQFVVTNVGQTSGNPSGLRVEFTASDVTAVPEPASWAMMIAGFGLVGAAMRRRTTAAIA
jgi:hypothetical protein